MLVGLSHYAGPAVASNGTDFMVVGVNAHRVSRERLSSRRITLVAARHEMKDVNLDGAGMGRSHAHGYAVSTLADARSASQQRRFVDRRGAHHDLITSKHRWPWPASGTGA